LTPTIPIRIYAGTYHLPWKTVDGGKTWNPIHQGHGGRFGRHELTIDQNVPSHIFASACSGFIKPGWRGHLPNLRHTERLGVARTHFAGPETAAPLFYAATTEGLWKTSDGGTNWHLVTPDVEHSFDVDRSENSDR